VSVVKAVFRRNLAAFFGNPAGYVFILLFVLLTSICAFVMQGFFEANLANLSLLTFWMPYILMIFIPAVTMSTWAEERKLGTDELLFTLPTGDFQIVLGKFLAALAVYTVTLAFTATHVVILCYLGDPDMGLIAATYLGYWLMGAAFIATGMFASSLTNNITIGFILGVLIWAVFAFAQFLGNLVPGIDEGAKAFAAVTHLESFSRGVLAFKDLTYFLSIIVVMIYLNSLVLNKRRWPGGTVSLVANPVFNTALRICSVVVIVISLNVLVDRYINVRADLTEEKLSSLSDETYKILDELSSDKPVYIQAWISKDFPETFHEIRDKVLHMLDEFDERGGDAVVVNIYRPDKFSQEAKDAKEKYNIHPLPVQSQDEGGSSVMDIILGAAFTCGVEEMVIPFFSPRMSVEYELTRTIRVVTKADRPKVGVMDNDLKMLGGFDFQTRSRSMPWPIVSELKKQYEVENIRADSPVPDDVDVIFAALPSMLKENELENLTNAVKSGKPTLLLMDPMPLSNIELSPIRPRPSPQQQNPFMNVGRQPPGEPKCDMNRLLSVLGVSWRPDTIVWDKDNPHPEFRVLPPECVFVTHKTSSKSGFNQVDEVSSGLQDLVTLFPGCLKRLTPNVSDLTFEPLLTTSRMGSGMSSWYDCVEQSFFGIQLSWESLRARARKYSPEDYIIAARVKGTITVEAPAEDKKAEADKGEDKNGEDAPKQTKKVDINVILVADLDLINYQMVSRLSSFRELDNDAFVLNCVDSLAGDKSFISLRKRRRVFRTLSRIEEIVNTFNETKHTEETSAEDDAKIKLDKAQARFDKEVKTIEERQDLDSRTKEIMLASKRRDEQQKFDREKTSIEEEKNRKIEESRFNMKMEENKIKKRHKIYAIVFPIIPPLLIAILIFFYRRSKENFGADETRLLRD